MIGQQIEKYKIIKEIGQGGMASVYLALDQKLEREVAIKILHSHLMKKKDAIERFQREAVTVASLHHQNIIEIYDYSGADSPVRFIVTEFIEGTTLGHFLDIHFEIPCELVACIARELCMALVHAHEQGIVHRDLKPENVMIRKDGKVKLMDFGIARVLEGTNLTMTGSILGSPAFMSPEHVRGKNVDFRSDLFSLGSILYLMVTGSFPFDGKNPHEVLKKVAEGKTIPAQEINPGISNEFSRILDKLMQTSPDNRFQSAKELLVELDKILEKAKIDNPKKEVHSLFSDPEKYKLKFQKQLVRDLIDTASSLKKYNMSKAIQTYNRIVALDPENEEANHQIDLFFQKNRSQKRMKAIAVSGLGLVLLAFVFYFALSMINEVPPKVATSEELQSVPPVPFEELMSRAKSERNIKKKPKSAKKKTPKKKVKKNTKSAAFTESKMKINTSKKAKKVASNLLLQSKDFNGSLQVVTKPWADIFIDNKAVGNYPLDANKIYALPAGKHKVELKNPGCETYSEIINIEKPEQKIVIRRQLKIKPAYINLQNSQGAIVFVDGKWKGRTPFKKPLEIRWDKPVPSMKVLVSLSKEGFEPVNKKVELRAGKMVELKLNLTEKK